ncbi:hypothetical protein [Paenibacillus mucilaginosus]|uniref:hypothetical protein n=1 Tax=Paenibacillus mucilaginosus TaxID=61624 RepID=UPI003D254DAC
MEERRKLFQDILELLRAPFPTGTVEYKGQSAASAHIPVQAYNHRVNAVAGNLVKWTLTTERPIIHEEEKQLEMRGILQIVDQAYEGQGFITFERDGGKGPIKFFGERSKAAASLAFVDACDKFEMGWIDLGRKWSDNPGTGVPQRREGAGGAGAAATKSEDSRRRCIRCNKPLTDEEEALLKMYGWNNVQCQEHIPAHVRKKYEEKVKQHEQA